MQSAIRERRWASEPQRLPVFLSLSLSQMYLCLHAPFLRQPPPLLSSAEMHSVPQRPNLTGRQFAPCAAFLPSLQPHFFIAAGGARPRWACTCACSRCCMDSERDSSGNVRNEQRRPGHPVDECTLFRAADKQNVLLDSDSNTRI